MKQLNQFKLTLFIVLGTMGTTFATSSFYGPSGLVTIPTAEAVRYKEYEFAYDYALAKDPKNDLWKYKYNLGMFKRVEVGVVGGNVPEEGMFLNLKYYLTATEERLPLSLAMGLKNLSSKDDSSLYMVASKKLRSDFTAHFGFEALFSEEKVTPVMMGGIEYMLDKNLRLMSDINADKDNYYLNAGIEYYVTKSFTVRVGALDLTNIDPAETRYSVGLSYRKFL